MSSVLESSSMNRMLNSPLDLSYIWRPPAPQRLGNVRSQKKPISSSVMSVPSTRMPEDVAFSSALWSNVSPPRMSSKPSFDYTMDQLFPSFVSSTLPASIGENTPKHDDFFATQRQEDLDNNNHQSFLDELFANFRNQKPPEGASLTKLQQKQPSALPKPPEPRIKEVVRVPSSAHVSYIVGKQGAKIRQIRTQTETLIQTPVNGEEPLFVIQGRRSNVNKARELILAECGAYDDNLFYEAFNYKDGSGRRRLNLYLPVQYIGLVVGKHGAAIKSIMASSGAEIVTPKVNTLNGFKISGTGAQIQAAVHLIMSRIKAKSQMNVVERRSNQFEITLDII